MTSTRVSFLPISLSPELLPYSRQALGLKGIFQANKRVKAKKEWQERSQVLFPTANLATVGHMHACPSTFPIQSFCKYHLLPFQMTSWDFSGGPVAKTPSSQCRGPRLDPWSGNYIPQDTTKILCATTRTRKYLNEELNLFSGRQRTHFRFEILSPEIFKSEYFR